MHQAHTFKVNGSAIRTLRMTKGVEISELADEVGITASYLSRLEVGTRRRVRPGIFAALRTALGATEDDLLAPPEDPPEGK